jgi:hypothetical protein
MNSNAKRTAFSVICSVSKMVRVHSNKAIAGFAFNASRSMFAEPINSLTLS